ncbi:MAG: ribokinase [Burkholderiaceae bacterium]
MTVHVLGSINVDHVALVERRPALGETVFGEYARFPGGKGANQAIAAARAGARVQMLGAVGRDAFGLEMLALLRADGIGVDGVAEVDSPTGVALITVDAGSQNSIVVCPGANAAVSAPDPARRPLDAGDVCLAQGEVPQRSVAGFFAQARAAGAATVFNPAPFRAMAPDFVALIDYLVLNEVEFGQFIGADTAPASREAVVAILGENDALGAHATSLVVTMGGAGVVCRAGGDIAAFDAPHVTPLDTVGAGDCFCGNFAARLAQGAGWREAIRYAVAAASLSVTRRGAGTSMPYRHEVALDASQSQRPR